MKAILMVLQVGLLLAMAGLRQMAEKRQGGVLVATYREQVVQAADDVVGL